jgi:hypothetical protein
MAARRQRRESNRAEIRWLAIWLRFKEMADWLGVKTIVLNFFPESESSTQNLELFTRKKGEVGRTGRLRRESAINIGRNDQTCKA